jgi:hypothetical protein
MLRILGDSQACGASGLLSPFDSRHAFLDAGTSTMIVRCRPGTRIGDWNKVIEAFPVHAGDPVLIFLGSNEADNLPDPAIIVSSLLRRGAKPVWVGPPLIRGKRGQAADHIAKIVQAWGVPFFDSRTLNLQQIDGVHPTPSEYARWLQAVLQSIPA